MAKRLLEYIKVFFMVLLPKVVEDLFILSGFAWLLITTYKHYPIVGDYLLAALLILFGILLAKRKS